MIGGARTGAAITKRRVCDTSPVSGIFIHLKNVLNTQGTIFYPSLHTEIQKTVSDFFAHKGDVQDLHISSKKSPDTPFAKGKTIKPNSSIKAGEFRENGDIVSINPEDYKKIIDNVLKKRLSLFGLNVAGRAADRMIAPLACVIEAACGCLCILGEIYNSGVQFVEDATIAVLEPTFIILSNALKALYQLCKGNIAKSGITAMNGVVLGLKSFIGGAGTTANHLVANAGNITEALVNTVVISLGVGMVSCVGHRFKDVIQAGREICTNHAAIKDRTLEIMREKDISSGNPIAYLAYFNHSINESLLRKECEGVVR